MCIKVNGAITHSELPKPSIIGDKVAEHFSQLSKKSSQKLLKCLRLLSPSN